MLRCLIPQQFQQYIILSAIIIKHSLEMLHHHIHDTNSFHDWYFKNWNSEYTYLIPIFCVFKTISVEQTTKLYTIASLLRNTTIISAETLNFLRNILNFSTFLRYTRINILMELTYRIAYTFLDLYFFDSNKLRSVHVQLLGTFETFILYI